MRKGFTLIELSIVLVIIGLIVGGVLTGRDLIKAAEVRATVTQVEKYNQAANTFRGKYGYLPGDMPDPPASSFGFVTPRGNSEGQGNGNGIISGGVYIDYEIWGETAVFWVDLSTAGLIDGNFSTARELSSSLATVTLSTTPNINAFFPLAKLGNGNYFYVWDGNLKITTITSSNYFGLSVLQSIGTGAVPTSTPGLTVKQAYDIDQKIDDGLPQSGNVTALYLNAPTNCCGGTWAAGGGVSGANAAQNAPTTAATSGSATTCYDNGGAASAAQQYSVEISNGNNINCALSFRFQ